MAAHIKQTIKSIFRLLVPLPFRKALAVWINHQEWLGRDRISWWCRELISDFKIKNINEYHKFLWSNHLAYADTYEIDFRFGYKNMIRSRKLFFKELMESLVKIGIQANRDIISVFEVGCSLGYQLRYMETDLFASATELEGVDIDKYAIRAGSGYLKNIGSKIRMICGDMDDLDHLMQYRMYDLIICTGVLMYLNENKAAQVVTSMINHTKTLLALAGLAHPDIDNSQLRNSVIRDSDGSFIHNIDAMVKRAGGDIIVRRWNGSELVDGQTVYFVFAKKSAKFMPSS